MTVLVCISLCSDLHCNAVNGRQELDAAATQSGIEVSPAVVVEGTGVICTYYLAVTIINNIQLAVGE